MHRRVVITGTGAISALGPDRETFWQRLCRGECGIRPLRSVDASLLSFGQGAEVEDFEPRRHFDRRTAEILDRFAQFFVVAAREAVDQAGLEWSDELRERTAIVAGSSLGGQGSEDREYEQLYGRNRPRVHPFSVPRIMANAGASALSLELGITGPGLTLSTACSSSNHAIGMGYWLVRQGVSDVALVGGSEALFSLGHLKAWEALRVVSPDTCRPFSRDRRGMILGEGGAVLLLESLEGATRRNASVLAEIAGFGMSSDASHMTQPSEAGAARAMRAALQDASMNAEEVGYVNAHGTATLANDACETRALRAVFGPHADRLAVSSTKSMHGHTLGAAGDVEAVATILALRDGLVPPTANFTEPDPECDLDVVPNRAREIRVSAALSNSFAFGGLNAVLAFRRFTD